MRSVYKKFGEKLNEIMDSKKLDSKTLSRMTGLSTSSISRYRNGLRLPDRKNAQCLADALNVSIEELTGLDIRN